MAESRQNPSATVDGAKLRVLPAPRLNLNNLEALRREMSRVYRDMRGGKIETQDGTRLVYVLAELGKMFERCELEARILALENNHGEPE